MGVVDFDPDNWTKANSEAAPPARVAEVAKEGGERASLSQESQLSQLGGLPPEIHYGLLSLASLPAPKVARPEVWPEVVADAGRLASDGWAKQALSLGWKPLELFGCSAAPGGDALREGLATWLAGRRVLLLDALSCIADDGGGGRSIFYGRSVLPGGVLLWELGRGARG